ncbi:MAG TPA: sterol desaturase family protein [Lacibacter sp.]|nr:sterol desaturase family protein [Lacibacter sp.]
MNSKLILKKYEQAVCFLIFSFLLAVIITVALFLKNNRPFFFHVILFGSGWFTWTFLEYVMHRFWTHGDKADKNSLVIQRHLHHHTHPTDIKVTSKDRFILIGISAVALLIAAWLQNFFTFFAGICAGISWFFHIHYFLHQTWAKKVFPRLLNFHIVHHCKFPNRCFCFSLTLWDDLFNTGIPPGTVISPLIIDFYFGEEQHH